MLAIIDYQMGNLRSVQKGFEKAGHAATITSDPAVLAEAEKIVLPGVGAFPDAIAELHRRHLVEPIKRAISEGKPFLGICLGLQLLFETGYGQAEDRRRSREAGFDLHLVKPVSLSTLENVLNSMGSHEAQSIGGR